MPRRRTLTDQQKHEIRTLWIAGVPARTIRAQYDFTKGQFAGWKTRLNLHARQAMPSMVLPADHRAVIDGRSLYPATTMSETVLKEGRANVKMGFMITKGRWSGMPIYSLTLEERATCPRTCRHWKDCYGNHMGQSKRQPDGDELVAKLDEELAYLNRRYLDTGFVVRLHILGDFFSVAYVRAWARWLSDYRALRVFGYTAWQPNTAIGGMVGSMNSWYPDRCWIRYSDGPRGTLRTGQDGIVCPVQTGKTRSCATCSLCWSTSKPIRFLEH